MDYKELVEQLRKENQSYDPLGDECQHPGGPCKEPERERWEKEE